MMKTRIIISIIIVMVPLLSILPSCSPDGEDVTIKNVKWTTSYVDYDIQKDTTEIIGGYIDTLVSYSLVKHRTEEEYRKDHDGKLNGSLTVHYITVRNENDSYSGRFAIKLTGKEYVDSSRVWRDLLVTTDYVSIGPRSSYTFMVKHPSWWRNESYGYNEGNVSIYVLQQPVNVYRTLAQRHKVKHKKTRRIDSLVISDTVVNNCTCDVDALNERYTTIKETFERLKNEHLIFTE